MAAIRINRRGYLEIDFRYQGKRHVLSTGHKDTKPNRHLVGLKAKAIEYGIKSGNLDVAMYFPQFKKEASVGNTLAEFFEFYMEEKSVKVVTMRTYKWSWNNYIGPHFGQWPLNNITKHEVLVFRNMIMDRKLKNGTVNLVLNHLSCILTRAVEEGKLAQYPMKKLGWLDSEGEEEIMAFSFEELRHLFNFLLEKKPEFYDLVYIWANMGFRIGEILALKWQDIDYFNSTLAVQRTYTDNHRIGTPKTKSSRRTLPLRNNIKEAFRRQEKRSRLLGEWVFVHPITNNRFRNPGVFRRMFHRILKLAGLRDRGANQLRHTFATLSIASGENITWVSRMMGHKNVSMTLERYNKYIPDLTRYDGSALERHLKMRQSLPDTLQTSGS